MSYWIQFIEQAGNNKDFSILNIERFEGGKLHVEIEDTYTDLETRPCIILRAEQVNQLRSFLDDCFYTNVEDAGEAASKGRMQLFTHSDIDRKENSNED